MATKYESEEKSNQFSEWCLLELMGHQRIEAVIGGVNLLRVDVPEVKGIAGYTRYFSGAAVYSLNPVTEELAESLRAAPIQRYELPRMGPVGYGYAPSEQEEAEEDRRDSGRDSGRDSVPF